ncbi:AbrB family transcriptional regulator [Desulfosporosinus lacus]|uniref:Membrane protein AbrB duplication n=1 Tax=Desulfosporosinus lacus DSM 15449 TaxID=1121420 RepID=A0A1M5ZMF9_9FIRM|nr:AbrB family transcriptional regulator [Desulfosporosinus lacus]SHI25535.1 hypothetical protein SAMN02746098_03436 [Desulfosporosinus lacus DSM 15449]
MNLIAQVGMIIGLALVSYWVFTMLHLPAPAILGPMVLIGACQILGAGLHELPMSMINGFQIIIGLSGGAKINHKNVRNIKNIWKVSLVIAVYTLASTAVFTFLIRSFTNDFATALFSAAPGGITEMTVMALSYDSEVAIVSTFQFVRLIVIVSLIPVIAKYVKGKHIPSEIDGSQVLTVAKSDYTLRRILIYVAGITGGVILLAVGFPGGGVIGAMLTVGFVNVLLCEEYKFPGKVMKFALIGVGVTIGLEFSPAMIQKIQEMMLPIAGYSLIVVLGNLMVGWFIRYTTHWDTITCILGSAPGGLSQMLVVGEEMEADMLKISIMQLVRVLTIILSIPIIAALLT